MAVASSSLARILRDILDDIAAWQPQPAPGDAPELRITDCSAHHDALHIQVNTGHNWLCAVALSAILAEYEPQPSDDAQPAPELAAAIQDIIDRYPEREPAPELAGSVVRVISTAPELREAMAETRKVAGLLDDFTHVVIDLDAGFGGKLATAAKSIRKKAGLPPVEGK